MITAPPLYGPVVNGWKSKAMVQLAPEASWKAAADAGVVCTHVEDLSQVKPAARDGLLPATGRGKTRGALPSLLTRTVNGLSELVRPTGVPMKASVGGMS